MVDLEAMAPTSEEQEDLLAALGVALAMDVNITSQRVTETALMTDPSGGFSFTFVITQPTTLFEPTSVELQEALRTSTFTHVRALFQGPVSLALRSLFTRSATVEDPPRGTAESSDSVSVLVGVIIAVTVVTVAAVIVIMRIRRYAHGRMSVGRFVRHHKCAFSGRARGCVCVAVHMV